MSILYILHSERSVSFIVQVLDETTDNDERNKLENEIAKRNGIRIDKGKLRRRMETRSQNRKLRSGKLYSNHKWSNLHEYLKSKKKQQAIVISSKILK